MNLTPFAASSRCVAFTSSATNEMFVNVPIRLSCPGGVNNEIEQAPAHLDSTEGITAIPVYMVKRTWTR